MKPKEGGDGDPGPSVNYTNSLVISTNNKIGIEAGSIGGKGGKGGNSYASFWKGRDGGDGGAGGNVNVTNNTGGQVATTGNNMYGIFAYSRSGKAGDGGSGYAAPGGGTGGHSSNGGQVTVTNNGNIITVGDGAYGIYGLSVSNNGGNGGSQWGLVGKSGNGGYGGSGGTVTITNGSTGGIYTSGNYAHGILAQSIGGSGGSSGTSGNLLVSLNGSPDNGGNGGYAVSVAVSGGPVAGSLSVGVGGNGGNGGAGGIVQAGTFGALAPSVGPGFVNMTSSGFNGSILTEGDGSTGFLTQSVGGGGGNGGLAVSASVSGSLFASGSVDVGVGGKGAGGGEGGQVAAGIQGNITTEGANATGLLAQSVGGGGGNGGGAIAAGISASGTAAGTITVGVGGDAGTASNGGQVTLATRSGTITTQGDNSTGILVESVGGGGGNGGYSISAGLSGAGPGAGTIDVGLNGKGGGGGDAGTVNADLQSDVTTSSVLIPQSVDQATGAIIPEHFAKNSPGIVVQSIGGGGGNGGFSFAGGVVTSGAVVSLSFGGSGKGGGNGGTVTIDNSAGKIEVTGDNSIAMYTQSVGGGGGSVGVSEDPPGQVGAFMFSGTAGGVGAAAATIVNQTGNLIAPGNNSMALVAQSSAPGGNGDITVNIKNGASPSLIEGGTGQRAAGVYIADGADNQLNNYGTITTSGTITNAFVAPDAGSGFAILGGGANDHITNYGYNSGINSGYGFVIGSVDLGAGNNSFDNGQNAVFKPGATVNLGAGNPLTNEGLLLPGGWNLVHTINVTGSFTQSATGEYGVDLDLKNRITDCLNITDFAKVSGTIAINLIQPTTYAAYALPGLHDNIMLSTVGALTLSGLTYVAPNTAVATYWLTCQADPAIKLNYKVDYSPSGLSPNEHSIGNAINRIQLAQVPGFRSNASALFFQPTAAGLGAIYDSLSGEGVTAAEQTSFQANDLFLTSIVHRAAYWLSGDPNDPLGHALSGDKDLLYARETSDDPPSGAAGAPPKAARNWRMWMSGYGGVSSYSGDAATGSAQVDLHGGGFAVGLDYQITPDTLVGIAGGSGAFSYNVSSRNTLGNVIPWHLAGYGAMRLQDAM